MKRKTLDSPLGRLLLAEEDGRLTQVRFTEGGDFSDVSPVLQKAEAELSEYFAGKRREFDLPLAPQGTEFQQKVWRALCDIPYGETRTYGEIARDIGSPGACRAVGMANHFNPIAVIIPCHRVIGANGSLTGYGGGLEKKIFLLELEKES